MPESAGATDATDVLLRLQEATNAHDLEAIVGCFAPAYHNDTPVHPARSFVGRDQVRRNWTQILAAIPDLTARVVAFAASGATVWSEWEQRGTRPDGSRHLMRGVIVFTVEDGQITTARFFLEPVDDAAVDVAAAVRQQVTPRPAP
jgi:ketosteroid isomerase-like protein